MLNFLSVIYCLYLKLTLPVELSWPADRALRQVKEIPPPPPLRASDSPAHLGTRNRKCRRQWLLSYWPSPFLLQWHVSTSFFLKNFRYALKQPWPERACVWWKSTLPCVFSNYVARSEVRRRVHHNKPSIIFHLESLIYVTD